MKKSASLVEITTVITIIALVTAITGVSISYIIPKRVETNGRKIVAELIGLRALSAARGEDMVARFYQNQDYIEFYDSSANLIKTVRLGYDVVTSPAANPYDLTFLAVFQKRKGIADADLDISLVVSATDTRLKVRVFSETGYIQFIR
jgi:hypothetical protein